jgi:hypothetical protein
MDSGDRDATLLRKLDVRRQIQFRGLHSGSNHRDESINNVTINTRETALGPAGPISTAPEMIQLFAQDRLE